MGRKARHTQEEVFQAAGALAASGKEVTATGLLAALGGGSLTTIYKHLDAWEEARKSAPAPVVIEMPDAVKASFAHVWQVLSSEAGREIAAIREKADTEIKAVTRRLDDAVDAIAQLEAEQEADAGRIEGLEGELATARADAQRAATEAATREAALVATAEQMRQQIATHHDELARMHAEIEAASERHAADLARVTGEFSRQLAEQTEVARAAREDVVRLRDELDDARKEHREEADRLRAVLEDARTATLQAEQRAAVAEARAADYERRTEELSAELAEAGLRERAKIEEAAAARAEAGRVTEQLKEQKARSVEVIGELEKSKQRMEAELSAGRDLAARLAQATGELEALRTQVATQQDVIKGFATNSGGERQS